MLGVVSRGWARMHASVHRAVSSPSRSRPNTHGAWWLAAALLAAVISAPSVSAASPNDATLANLTLSAGMLGSPFDPAVTNYTASETASQTSISVTPMTTDPGATVTVNGSSVPFNTASGAINLAFGNNTVTIVVTSQDTTATQTYTVTVNRALSADDYLSNLTISAGTLTPTFDPNTNAYTATVTSGTASLTITPTLEDSNASMTVNAQAATSGSAFGPVSLNYGTTTIGVQVTAQDGTTTQAYTVTITRPTPGTAQTITFNNPGTQNFGTSPTLSATATSNLAVSFSSSTTGVCTVTSGGALTFVTAGTCTINADQAGDGTYSAAPTVSQSFTVAAVVPGAPTVGAATAGDTQATVSFTAPASAGGATITGYTVTSSPGGFTGTGASSPITVTGLTNGTAYIFTVTATNSAGTGSASAASNSATPKAVQTVTFANPGAQTFGTSPTLTATSTSSLTVAFSSSTTGVCTITSGGALTFVAAGTCTINADQAGNASFLAASTVSQSFAVNAVVPGAPTIGSVTAGNTQASVAFTAPASNGGATITGYTATSNPGGFTGTCASSPCTVTGLTNGTAYTFTVTATNSAGTSSASAASSGATPAAASSNADLSALAPSSGTLSPSFTAATTSYTASVANGTSSITVTPTLADATATVKVNGTTVASGSASGAISLAVGSNTVTVLVTAQDGTTTKTYTLTVTRAAAPPPAPRSSNANLSALSVAPGTLDRTFAATDRSPYVVAVGAGISSITIVPTAADPSATVTVNGIAVASGTPSRPVSLPAGTTAIVIRVTAPSGAQSLYEVDVTRASIPANDADLSRLQVCAAGTCTPVTGFDPATTSYQLAAPSGPFQVQATADDPNARVTVNGNQVTSGNPSASFSAPAGVATPIAVTVESRDGTTKKTYSLVFGQAAPSVALKALAVSTGTLSPAFDADTASYTVTAPAGAASVTLTPTAADPAAQVSITRSDTTIPVGPSIILTDSPQTLWVTVTQTDRRTRTYFVTVKRAAPTTVPISLVSPAALPVAKVGQPFSATFEAGVVGDVTWTATGLPDGVTLSTSPTTRSNGTDLPNGSATLSGTPTASDAGQTFHVVLTAALKDGSGQGTGGADITVSGGATPADLSRISLTTVDGQRLTLSPAFDPAVTEYTVTTSAHALAPVAADTADDLASWSVNAPAPFSNGWPLAVGANVFQFIGASLDGKTHKTYTVTVTRLSNNADLSGLSVCESGNGCQPVAGFNAATTSYTVPSQALEQMVVPTTVDSHATVTVNNQAVASGTTSQVTRSDNNFPLITVKVTSQDGTTTKTYTVLITHPAPLTIQGSMVGAYAGSPYSGAVTASGGTAPYTFKSARLAGGSDLPAGLTLASDGKVSGTPTAAGLYTFGVQATDKLGATGQGLVTVKFSTIPSVVFSITQTLSGISSDQTTQVNLDLFKSQISQVLSVSTSRISITSVSDGGPATSGPAAAKAPAGQMAGRAGQTLGASSGGGVPVLTYTPNANAMGLDHIVVTALLVDGSTEAAALDFQVAGKAPDLTMQVAANGIATLDPTASVVGGPFMGVQILAPPAFGTVVVSGLQVLYIPDPAHTGTTSFVYAVDLGFGLSAPGVVTVTTTQPVSAAALSATTHAGQPVSLDLTAQAQGGPFSGAAVLSVSPASAGTASVRSTGARTFALDFIPAGTFTGPVSVGYSLTANGATADGVATITVDPRPDPSLDPEVRAIVSATDQAVRTFARSQLDNFNRRLESLRGGESGGFDMKLGFATPPDGTDPRDQGAWHMQRLAQQSAKDPTAAAPGQAAAFDAGPGAAGGGGRPSLPSPFGTWVAGVIQIGHADGTTQRRDYRLSTSGLSAGVDYRLSDRLVVGAGLGYGHDDTRIGSKGSNVSGESKVGAAYGAWLPTRGTFVDAVLGYGRLDFDVARFSSDAAKVLNGSRSGTLLFGSLRAGLDRTNGGLHVSPYGEVSFIDGRLDAFTEAGDPIWALAYGTQDVRSLAGTLGLRLDVQRKLSADRTLTPRIRIEWRHEFDEAGDQTLSYADWSASPHYVVPADQLGRDELSVELGGRLQLEHQLSLDLGYRGMFSNGMRSGAWSLRLDHSF